MTPLALVTGMRESKASYKVEGIKPYFDVSFGSADAAKTSFKAGLELTMISHLTTTLQYATEDIGGTDKGEVTTALKIFVLEEILFRFFGTRRRGVHRMVHPSFFGAPSMGSGQEVRSQRRPDVDDRVAVRRTIDAMQLRFGAATRRPRRATPW